MKYLVLFILITQVLFADPIREEFEVDGGSLPYYVEFPDAPGLYPLVVILEGSFVEELGPQSVLRLHEKLAQPFLHSGIGLITMEKRGIDGKQVDIDRFHRFNTPSQRLNDHIQLIQHLKAHPPQYWNGQLIILAGSEGGPIGIKLAYATDPAACIVVVGCGDQTYADYIWNFIESFSPEEKASASLPEDRASYEMHLAMMKANPDPTQFWIGQSYLHFADTLDQTEDQQFLSLTCPVFVVSGSEDIECASTDRLIALAQEREQDVTYLRVEGMGHDALDPQWDVMPQVLTWLSKKL